MFFAVRASGELDHVAGLFRYQRGLTEQVLDSRRSGRTDGADMDPVLRVFSSSPNWLPGMDKSEHWTYSIPWTSEK
jgi:hypothetical protein